MDSYKNILLSSNYIKSAINASQPSLAVYTDKSSTRQEVMEKIKHGINYISTLTQIEIVSAIGKYSRGKSGGKQLCDRIISEAGDRCVNFHHEKMIKRWKNAKTRQWLKLVDDTTYGLSPILNVSVLPLTDNEIMEAQRIITYALTHKFGSLDALIAATAKKFHHESGAEIIVVTSDKGLKACLDKCSLPYLDAFE